MRLLPFDVCLETRRWRGNYQYEEACPEPPAYGPICTVLSLFIDTSPTDLYDIIDPAIIHQIEKQLRSEATE